MSDLASKMGSLAATRRAAPHLLRNIAVITISAALSACSGISADQLETGSLAPQQTVEGKPGANASTASKADAGNTSAKLSELKAKHKAAPTAPDTSLAYAAALKGNGQLKEARDVVSTAHAAHSSNIELTGTLGLLELELGQAAKAQKLLQAVTSSPTSDWRYQSGLGVAYAVQGRPADAREQFQKALAKSPGNKTILNNLAMTYVMDKKLDKAEGLLQQAKTGDGVPETVGKNLQLAAQLRKSAPVERRADTDTPAGKPVAN